MWQGCQWSILPHELAEEILQKQNSEHANRGTSLAKYQKTRKANKPCENEHFRDFCHQSNIILLQIMYIVYILGHYTLNQTH